MEIGSNRLEERKIQPIFSNHRATRKSKTG